MAQNSDKTELIAELAQARARTSVYTQALRKDLDVPTRVRKAFKSSPLPWLGGAGLVGIILARLSPGRAKTKPVVSLRPSAEPALKNAGKAGLLLGVLKMVLDLLRPAITNWAKTRLTDYLATRAAQGDGRRPRV